MWRDGSFEQVIRAGEALRRRVRTFTGLISLTTKCCTGAEISHSRRSKFMGKAMLFVGF